MLKFKQLKSEVSDCAYFVHNPWPETPSDTILFAQEHYFYVHLSAVFEWMLSVNLELFELSYAVEFLFFSSYMLSNVLSHREEEKPLMLSWHEAARAQPAYTRSERSEDGLDEARVETVAGSWLHRQ